jgi:hypothetical protein
MTKNNLPDSINLTQAFSLDRLRVQLHDAVDRLFDVDASLSIFVKKCHEDDVNIDLDNGDLVSAARPIDIAKRELEAIRNAIDTVANAIERDLNAVAETKKHEEKSPVTMSFHIDRRPQFLVDAEDGETFFVEHEHSGHGKLTACGYVTDDVLASLKRKRTRMKSRSKAA